MTATATETAPRLRPAAADDVPAIQAIYAHYVLAGSASFEIEPPDEAEMAARLTRVTEAGYPFIVAEADGTVGGYAYASSYRARPAYRNTVENSVYVAPGFLGRGLGRMLLEDVIRQCTEAGFRQMIAVIGDSGNAPSIRLHERCGFVRAGVLKNVGWKHERWIDTVLMQRALGEGERQPPDTG